jgi:hypothetical protein
VKISETIDQYKAKVLSEVKVSKEAETGKILKFLKSLKDNVFLAKIIKSIEGEESEMDKKEIESLIDDKLTKAAADIQKKIDELPKPMTAEEIGKALKVALDESMKDVSARIEKVEKASPGSKQDDKPLTPDEISKEEEMGRRIAKIACPDKVK